MKATKAELLKLAREFRKEAESASVSAAQPNVQFDTLGFLRHDARRFALASQALEKWAKVMPLGVKSPCPLQS